MSKSNQSAGRTGPGGKALCFFSHTHTEPTWTPEKKFTTVQFCVTSCNTEPASASAGFTEEAILSQLAFRGCQDGPTYVPPGQSWTRAKMVEGKRNWRDTEDVPTNSKLKAMNNPHNSRMFKVRCHQILVVVQKQGFCEGQPLDFLDGGGDEKIANHGCHHQLMMVAPAQGCRGGHASRSPSLLHLI